MRASILVFGATGTVGSALVRRLLDVEEIHVTAVRHRGSPATGLPVHERLVFVEGDVTQPDFGWDTGQRTRLAQSMTHICHLAASTKFHLPLDEIRRVNVRGTEHALSFAETCPRLEQFGFASTVFVSGRRTGPVYEHELTHDTGFVNTYEQSKYEAESLVHGFADRAPVAVYRLSTVFGDSRSGAVQHYTAPHQALRIMSLGLASMLPGSPDYKVNLIPSDVAVGALARLVMQPAPRLTTYHLAAPDEKCFTLEEMVEESYRQFSAHIPGWERRKYPKPAIVSQQAFDRFMESVTRTGNPLLGGVMGALGHFAHQLLYPKSFDLANTEARLPGYGERMPHIRSYFGKVVESCLSTQWGSNVHAE